MRRVYIAWCSKDELALTFGSTLTLRINPGQQESAMSQAGIRQGTGLSTRLNQKGGLGYIFYLFGCSKFVGITLEQFITQRLFGFLPESGGENGGRRIKCNKPWAQQVCPLCDLTVAM